MNKNKEIDLAPYARCDMCGCEDWKHKLDCPVENTVTHKARQIDEDRRFSAFVRANGDIARSAYGHKRGIFGRVWDRVFRMINDRKS